MPRSPVPSVRADFPDLMALCAPFLDRSMSARRPGLPKNKRRAFLCETATGIRAKGQRLADFSACEINHRSQKDCNAELRANSEFVALQTYLHSHVRNPDIGYRFIQICLSGR